MIKPPRFPKPHFFNTARCSLVLAALYFGCFAAGLLAQAKSSDGSRLYVAPNGNDNSQSPDNPATPLKTIQKAVDLAQFGDTVIIRAGTYRETVRVRKMATAEKPITITAYPGESPVISGTETVAGPWRKVEGNIYEADLPAGFQSALNQTEQLFADGQMLFCARYPNFAPGELFQPDKLLAVDMLISEETLRPPFKTPWGDLKPQGGQRVVFTVKGGLPQPDGYWTGMTLWMIPRDKQGEGWGFGSIGPILSHTNGQIEAILFFLAGTHNLQDVSEHDPFYLFGKAEALDAPGEWFHDLSAGKLRIWLPDGSDPSKHLMEIKRRDFAFDLSDSAHVTVKNLGVFGATVTTDRDFGKCEGGGEWASGGRGSEGGPHGNAKANHITIDGLRARYISHFEGTWGFPHGQWLQGSGIMLVGEDHVLKNSTVEYSAGNGVVLFGPRHKVVNNVIHDVNYAAAHASAIYLHQTSYDPKHDQIYPMDCEVAHNTLYRAGWGLIDASKIYSSDPKNPSRIHHNFIDASGLYCQDVGGIRLVSRPSKVPGDPTRQEPPINGTRFDHNWVRNVVGPLGDALYFDFCAGYVADHNLVTDCNIFICINDCGEMNLYNNTGWRLQRGIGGLLPGLGKPGKMNFKDLNIYNNILDRDIQPAKPGKTDPTYLVTNNLEKANLAEFYENPARYDFRVKSGAAPDIGAFETGQESWLKTVGADFQIVKAPTDLTGTAKPDGTVALCWKDNSDNEDGFVIERATPMKHNHPGWEYVVIGRVPPNTTNFSVKISAPVREYMFRVRATRSFYSNTLYLWSGAMAGTIGFEKSEGYAPGNLNHQQSWIGLHSGNGINQTEPTVFTVATSSTGGQRMEITGTEERREIISLGRMSLLDENFVPGKSKLSFSFRWGLKSIDGADNGSALKVQFGGPGYWKSPSEPFTFLELFRDGTMKAWWTGIGKLGEQNLDAEGMVRVSGIIDLAAGKLLNLEINGKVAAKEAPLPGKSRTIEGAVWQVSSNVKDAEHTAWLDDLSMMPTSE